MVDFLIDHRIKRVISHEWYSYYIYYEGVKNDCRREDGMPQKEDVTRWFDYIVVGTGPAGSVMTKKLSDGNRHSVLTLEAGTNQSTNKLVRDSKFAIPILLYDQYAPQFYIPGHGAVQKQAANRTFPWTGGRLLGGGSSVNNQQYVRPSAQVMRKWQGLLGPNWSPEEEVRHFKDLENYNGWTTNEAARGYSGRLDIRQTQIEPTNVARKFVEAISRATSYPEVLDYNDPTTPLGPFLRYQLYQRPNGIRASADTAILSPDIMTETGQGVDGRRLTVAFNATVTRILFENQTAIGVEFIENGKCYYAYAKKKVVLSAGISSVPILLQSGIGDEQKLRELDIPVIAHNPNVGKHYADHPAVTATFKINPNDHVSPYNDPNSLYAGGAFLPNPTPGSNPYERAIQLFTQAQPLTGERSSEHRMTIGAILLQPKSRGQAFIQNKDPLTITLGDQGYLTDPADLKTFMYTYKVYIRRIAEQLAAIDPTYELLTPSMEIIQDDHKLEAFIRDSMGHGFHPQSMNRMHPDPTKGVVDARGHVHGVQNLVIADDTIIPYTVDGNTSAPAFLIGATIAEQLLEESI